MSPATPLLDTLLVYLRLFGKKPTREEFLAGLPIEGHADLSVDLGKRALKRYGCAIKEHRSEKLDKNHLPLCALMKNGSWCVIIDFRDADYLIMDTSLPNGVRPVARERFESDYAGFALQALLSVEEIERRNVGKTRTGHWFWGHFRGQSGLIRDIVLGSFIANLLAVAVSLFALQVYDRVIPNQSVETLWVLVIGAVIAISMEAFIKTSRSRLMDCSGKTIELDIGEKLFERLLGMKMSGRQASPSSLIYAVREFGSVREFFTAASVGTVADLPFVLIFLLLVYGIAGPVVLVMIAAMILIILPSLFAKKTMARLAEEMQGGAAAQNKLLIEAGYGADTIKATRAEGFFQRQWEEIGHLNAIKTTEQRALSAGLSFWAAAMMQLAYIFVVVTGVYLVFAGEFTIGTIIAVTILSSRILTPATQLSSILARWQQVKASMGGLEMIVTSDQDRPVGRKFSRKEVLQGDIEIRDLGFSYDPDSPQALQLRGIKIRSGKNIAVLGSNGSGKSTLLKLLSGLYSPTSGTVLLDQLDIAQLDPDDIRRNIGYLPQEVKLFTGTLRDNLALGSLVPDESDFFAAIDFAGLGRHVRTHPLGLDMMISDGGEGLSTGQRQSVGLARLFLMDPRIVLLDEPTATFDQRLEQDLVRRLGAWLKHRTSVISTHRLPVLDIIDEIIVLSSGSVAMHGPRDDVLRKIQSPVKLAATQQEPKFGKESGNEQKVRREIA